MKTYSAKNTDVERKWWLVDASDLTLGRLSTVIATKLTGKDKPMFSPHVDCGDYVVVINSDKLVVTGDKLNKKTYYRHSGFPGNLKESSLQEQIDKDSRNVIIYSVRGMLPKNKLQDPRIKRLKVYAGPEHDNTAQQPTTLNLKEGK